jgi:hypothetical protein
MIANVWAKTVTARWNMLFGSDFDTQVIKLEGQAEDARQNWDKSQKALIEYLPISQADILQVNLSQAREALRINHN